MTTLNWHKKLGLKSTSGSLVSCGNICAVIAFILTNCGIWRFSMVSYIWEGQDGLRKSILFKEGSVKFRKSTTSLIQLTSYKTTWPLQIYNLYVSTLIYVARASTALFYHCLIIVIIIITKTNMKIWDQKSNKLHTELYIPNKNSTLL